MSLKSLILLNWVLGAKIFMKVRKDDECGTEVPVPFKR
jgi:hypothetical protein